LINVPMLSGGHGKSSLHCLQHLPDEIVGLVWRASQFSGDLDIGVAGKVQPSALAASGVVAASGGILIRAWLVVDVFKSAGACVSCGHGGPARLGVSHEA